MYSKVLVVLALTSLAYSHDILLGENNTGNPFYHEHYEASPAIWKQTKDLFINVNESNVISKINITDLRPDKDGEAQIVSGGVGHSNVSIVLKSPTVFRGYDFLVEVFSLESEVPYVPGQHHGNETQATDGSTTANLGQFTTAKTTFVTGTPTTRAVTGHATGVPSTTTTTEAPRPMAHLPKDFESKTEVTTESEIPLEVQGLKMQPFDGPHFENTEGVLDSHRII